MHNKRNNTIRQYEYVYASTNPPREEEGFKQSSDTGYHHTDNLLANAYIALYRSTYLLSRLCLPVGVLLLRFLWLMQLCEARNSIDSL